LITHKVTINLDSTNTQTWRLYPIGDIHLGNVGCDKTALSRTIKTIKDDPLARWIGLGDYAEYIGWTDPRFEPESVDKEYKVNDFKYWGQRMNRDVIKHFEPIADKCIGLMSGNHEKTVADRYLFDPTADLAERLKAKYLGYECMIGFKVLRHTGRCDYGFDAYCHHGFGGGRKPGSVINNLVDLAAYYQANLFLTGHTHKIISTKINRLRLTEKCKLVSEDVAFLVCGTYLRMKQENMEGYEVKKGLPPTFIGSPYIEISNNKDMHGGYNFELRI